MHCSTGAGVRFFRRTRVAEPNDPDRSCLRPQSEATRALDVYRTAKPTPSPSFIATTVMLSFISFWRAAAIVLSDLASSAYYAGGEAEHYIGKPVYIQGLVVRSDDRGMAIQFTYANNEDISSLLSF